MGWFGNKPQYTINLPLEDIWPTSLDASNLPSAGCLQGACPGLGYEMLLKNTLYWRDNTDMAGFSRPSAYEPWNITSLEPAVATKPFSRPLTAALDCFKFATNRGKQYGTVTSTPSLVVAAGPLNVLQHSHKLPMEFFWQRAVIQVDSVGPLPPKKPFVQVKCIDAIHDSDFNDTGILHFPNYGLVTPGFSRQQIDAWNFFCESWDGAPNLYKDQRFDVKASELFNSSEATRHMADSTSYFSWLSLSKTTTVSPSIAVAVQFPPCDNTSPAAIYACTVDARWLPTRIWIEPTADTAIHTTRGKWWSFLTVMADDLTFLAELI